jgi:hypothetical protein
MSDLHSILQRLANLAPAVPAISAVTALLAVVVGPVVTALLTHRQILAASSAMQSQLQNAKRLADDQLQSTRRTANKQAVAPMRQAWINGLRERVAKLPSFAARIKASPANLGVPETVQFAQTHYEILLMLNPGKPDHQALERLVEELVIFIQGDAGAKEEFWAYRLKIVDASRKIFKREWDRIKTEDAN